ncbi:MAG: serine/threonine-protein kinase [Acidobacteriota bacterium]
MTPEQWQKVKVVLNEAVEISPSRRADLYERACPGDDDIRREVESLLEFDNGDSPLDAAPFSFGDDDQVEQTALFIGRQIGEYRIIDVIAAGGMGTVYLAERGDDTYVRRVALKVIKRGMESDAVRRRFINERRILASLEHPLIAQLIDGGTTDDHVPYFVMEYVEGVPITDFVRDNALSVPERLRLFIDVAAAVAYAHQNLVIHRDLKPSNILVTSSGKPKLLDFGIAKLLQSGNGGLITATQQFVLTPDYASPEQVRREQLSTATDIYSLGLILYEMLAGTRPYRTDASNFGEVLRVVCESMPQPPSRVVGADASRLKGDLDNIVLKAIRKEPERRYSSVEQFSRDITRHLNNLPVIAASDTWRYRAGKFIARNRLSVVAAALILISLLGGLATTLYQRDIARRERAKAEQRYDDVRHLANSFMFEVNDKIDESPLRARELLISRAIEYLDKLAQESDGDVALLSELATAYEKIGDVQSRIFDPGLGKTSAALISHRKALQIREQLYAAAGSDATRGNDVVRSRMLVGDIETMTGHMGEARSQYEQAAELGEELLKAAPADRDIRANISRANARLGQNILRSGSLADALVHYERALTINRELLAETPDDRLRQHAVSVNYNYIGFVKMEMLDNTEATQYFSDALAIDEAIAASDPRNSQYRRYTVDSHLWLGLSEVDGGAVAEGLRHLNIALDEEKALFASDPANLGERNGVADCYLELGKAHLKAGQTAAAIESFELAMGHYSAVWQTDTANLSARIQVLVARRFLADALTQKGETARAEALYTNVLGDLRAAISGDPENSNWQNELGQAELGLADNLAKRSRANAAAHYQAAADILGRLATLSPGNARLGRDAERAKAAHPNA